MAKSFLKRMRSLLARCLPASVRNRFAGSDVYWKRRYSGGGNSGPGSYGRLAVFKANFVNSFVKETGVASVIEFGCGDGDQLALADYPAYIGTDVSKAAIERCRKLNRDRPQYRFMLDREYTDAVRADLSLSMDVIFHLVEDDVFERYMKRLFAAAKRYVVIYSSNYASEQTYHVRHRRFTDWVDRNEPSFECIQMQPNAYPFDPERPEETSASDFYVYQRR